MNFRRQVLEPALALSLLTTSGCALFGVGEGAALEAAGAAYVLGKLEAVENVTIDQAWEATLQAVEELEFEVALKSKDKLAASLKAKGARNRPLWIKLRRQTDDYTEITVRVGYLGDATHSLAILETIRKRY